jgi:NTE family protein
MILGRGAQVKKGSPFALVLSGGGLRGLAHIGVFQALEEYSLVPNLVVGSSIGALIGAAWACGESAEAMTARALQVERRHVFQVAHTDLALRRMRSPAVYRREPLETLIRSIVGTCTFRDVRNRLLVNTVDLASGRQHVWGMPGTENVRLAAVVFASCALPGVFPPQEIGCRQYVDGAIVENLPVRVAANAAPWPILAVNVATTSVERNGSELAGFAATSIRSLEIVMQTQIDAELRNWSGPPLVLIQPAVAHISMFAFDRTPELIAAGYRATRDALDALGGRLDRIAEAPHPRWPPTDQRPTRASTAFAVLPAEPKTAA